MPYDKKTFSENLNRYLALHDENQSDLCSLCGVSSSTASGWCNGSIMPRMDKVQQLADHFGCRLSDLVERPENTTPTVSPDDIKAAFWGGDKDLSKEDLDAMWTDVKNFAAFVAQKKKQEKEQDG